MTKPVGRPRKNLARHRNGDLTPKREAMIEAMVFKGLSLAEAAVRAGLTPNAGHKAMRCPKVVQHFEEQRRTLLASQRARNIHALAEVRDESANDMARVNAVKALEVMASDAGLTQGAGSQATPGIVIMVSGPAVMSQHASGGLAIQTRSEPQGTVIDLEPIAS